LFLITGITDYIKGGYLMRRAWKLYDKCYCEISAIGGPFLMWAPELRGEGNGALQSGLDEGEEALDEVMIKSSVWCDTWGKCQGRGYSHM